MSWALTPEAPSEGCLIPVEALWGTIDPKANDARIDPLIKLQTPNFIFFLKTTSIIDRDKKLERVSEDLKPGNAFDRDDLSEQMAQPGEIGQNKQN